jgi:hypothetical protein
MPTILKEDSILRQGWILIGRVGSDSKIGYYSWRIGEGNSNDAAKKNIHQNPSSYPSAKESTWYLHETPLSCSQMEWITPL